MSAAIIGYILEGQSTKWRGRLRSQLEKWTSLSEWESWDGWGKYYRCTLKMIGCQSKLCIGKWTIASSENQEDQERIGLILCGHT